MLDKKNNLAVNEAVANGSLYNLDILQCSVTRK